MALFLGILVLIGLLFFYKTNINDQNKVAENLIKDVFRRNLPCPVLLATQYEFVKLEVEQARLQQKLVNTTCDIKKNHMQDSLIKCQRKIAIYKENINQLNMRQSITKESRLFFQELAQSYVEKYKIHKEMTLAMGNLSSLQEQPEPYVKKIRQYIQWFESYYFPDKNCSYYKIFKQSQVTDLGIHSEVKTILIKYNIDKTIRAIYPERIFKEEFLIKE